MAKIIQVARFTADGTNVERTFKQMGDAGQQMSQRVERGAKAIPPAMRAVDASAGVAKQKLDGLASSTGSLGTVLTSLGPVGVAAAAAIGGLTLAYAALGDATRNAVRDLGAIDIQARRLGVSTDALQEYRFAAIGAGQAAEQADAAITGFNERLGEALIKQQGAGYETLTRALGFTPEEVANMRETEEVLPRVIERIAQLGTEAEQLRAAKELGLEPFLAVIQQGPGAFDRAAEAARNMGYVLDRELLARAAEFSGQWEKASRVIDVQFKSALVDLAPTFIFLAEQIGNATTALVGFIDRFKELEDRSRTTLERNASEALQGQVDLMRRHGGAVWEGGDAERGERLLNDFERLPGLGGVPHATTRYAIRSDRDAADLYAALTQRRNAIMAELAERDSRVAQGAGVSPTGSLVLGGSPGADPMAQARAWIDTLREEQRVRDDLLRITQERAGVSREEAESIRVRERDLARLKELRDAGVIQSDDELRTLSAIVQLRHDDAEATRRQAEAQRIKQSLLQDRQAAGAFEQAAETPRERMLREIEAAEAMRGRGASNESVDRTIASITRAYEDMTTAQLRSSEAGWALEAALRGQIRSVEDLEEVMISMAQNYAIEQFFRALAGAMNGGGQQGGKGGFNWGGFIGSIFSGMFGGGGGGAGFGATRSGTGGPRGGGGPTHPGMRHPAAENGVEMSVVGGWGQVLPNGTFEAIAALARTVQRAQQTPAPAMAGGAPIQVTINNQAGVDVNVEERQAEGLRQIEIMVTRKTGADLASGEHDGAMRGRFGARPPRTRRG